MKSLDPQKLADFRAHVVEHESGCSLWKGESKKYGIYKGRPAHRVSWELHQGPIDEGLLILHGCNTKGCVNPHHLRPGTPKENAQDYVREVKRKREEAERRRWEAKRKEMLDSFDRGRQWLLDQYGPDAFTEEEVTLRLPRWAVERLAKKAEEWSIFVDTYLSDVAEEQALDNGLWSEDESEWAAYKYMLAARNMKLPRGVPIR